VIDRAIVIEEIVRTIEEHRRFPLLIAIGFDGVLVPYRQNPADVRLRPDAVRVLMSLPAQLGIALAIVSGRPVADLKRRAALGPSTYYVGLHGLEIDGPGLSFVDRRTLDAWRPVVREIAIAVEQSVSTLGRVRVEDKGPVLALHTRGADPDDATRARVQLLSAVARTAHREDVRVIRGNHVLELMPDVPSPRAAAINTIRRRVRHTTRRPVFSLYIGEDVADDDVFAATEGVGISAAVGSRARRAQYHLEGLAEVRRLIEHVVLLRAEDAVWGKCGGRH
jgi:trehalose 6-phosphate phosphatase